MKQRVDGTWLIAAFVLLGALALGGYFGWPFVERAFGWNQAQSLCSGCIF